MSNYTPGPWIVVTDSTAPGGIAIEQDGSVHDEPSLVADIMTDGSGIDEEVGNANADLIAAAPRLLDALKRWEQFAQDNQWSESDCTFLAETRAAIAAAEPQPATI
jgi:hypothetical protein